MAPCYSKPAAMVMIVSGAAINELRTEIDLDAARLSALGDDEIGDRSHKATPKVNAAVAGSDSALVSFSRTTFRTCGSQHSVVSVAPRAPTMSIRRASSMALP